ncbi:unnamed protein product [Somion occarium]|uniref:Nuclear pore complex protein n=1 Tax=Somion occarium TaxID=3059160 RepID=A0ABP1D501_9APHY
MSETLYASCAQVLSLAQAEKDNLDALLDPEKGFAPCLRQICHDRWAELKDKPEGSVSPEELEALRMERDTWGLLQAVMPLRKLIPQSHPNAQALLLQNPYAPTSELAEAIMNSSRFLTELVAVREWLQDIAPYPPAGPGPATGYWKFTKYEVLQNTRMGKGKERETAGAFVMELDPDAPNRTGRALAADDATYDKALAQVLYALIRAGKIQEAIDICLKAQQPWRAASIRGTMVFQWRALSANQTKDEDAMEDDEDFSNSWRGNQHRKLWKSTCERAALNPNLTDAERALYAALAPCPQTSTTLKAACRTWEDHLWAQVCIICEEKESEELARLRNSFWEGTLGLSVPEENMDVERGEEEEWENDVVKILEGLSNASVEEGSPAEDPYHISQLHIILDRTDQLLQEFAASLAKGEYDTSSPQYPTMTRFFAHLCLFLQMIDITPPPLATQVVLEAYLRVLEAAGERELIAMYAGALGDNAIERYAMFLTSLAISADTDERKLALKRARDHGLDIDRVAVVTAERTIEKAFELLPRAAELLPDVTGEQSEASDVESLLLRSIEWTTFMESTYYTALEQANVILRYFLGVGRLPLAKAFLKTLPPQLNTLREPEVQATEFLHYRQFFMVWEALDRVVQFEALGESDMASQTRAAWLEDYKILLQQAREQVTRLLTTEWLVSEEERMNGDDRRLRELIRIRQIYIPVIIKQLHTILYRSRRKVPENLKHALLLANIVADSRYRLYEDFVAQEGRRLGDYLALVKQAVLGGLEGGGSDAFRVLHT